jgi:hypothetical protein
VIDQVRKALPLDRHAQLFHVREVGGRQPARMVLLHEKHLAAGTFRCPPVLHVPLQRPQLPILKSPRVASLQILKQRLGFQPGAHFQLLLDLSPNIRKRIGPPAAWLHR